MTNKIDGLQMSSRIKELLRRAVQSIGYCVGRLYYYYSWLSQQIYTECLLEQVTAMNDGFLYRILYCLFPVPKFVH